MHLQSIMTYILAILLLPSIVHSTPSATVSSSTNYIGDLVNYTITLANHTVNGSSPTKVSFVFPNWTPTVINPFLGTRAVYLGLNQLTCPNAFPSIIQCTFVNPTTNSSAWTNGNTSNMVFNITGMYNPSSSKPYTFAIQLNYANGSTSTINTTITVSQMTTEEFILSGYSYVVGAVSPFVSFSLDMNNYFSQSTYLAMSYNSSLTTITAQSTSAYSIINTTLNSTTHMKTILISTWQSTNTLQSMTNWNISNPPAALSYTLSGYMYWVEGANTWNISLYSCTVQLIPISYTTMASSSILQYGSSLPTISINATCSQTANNQSNSSSAYSTLTYDPTIISTTNSSCIYLTNSSCKYPSTVSPLSITGMLTSITNASAATFTISSYTYWSASAAFYPLCSSSLTLPITTQSITANVEGCGSGIVNAANIATNMTLVIYSYKVGDIVTITGLKGTISNTTQWYSTGGTNNNNAGNSSYAHVLGVSDYIINASYLKILFSYVNPSYLASPNLLAYIKVSRIGSNASIITYGSVSTPAICPVSIPSSISVASITASNQSTYASTNLSLILSLNLFDYTVNDYIIIAFKTGGKDNIYALANTGSITINNLSMKYTLSNTTAIRISLGDFSNSSSTASILPTSLSRLWTILIYNITNSVIVETQSIYLTTYSAISSTVKEALQSPLQYSLTALPLILSITALHPLTSQHLSLSISSPLRAVALRNSSILSSAVTITIPSLLNCPTSTISNNWMTSVATTSSPFTGNTTNLVIDLGTCNVGYFTAAQLSITVVETISNVSSSSSTVALVNACGDNCYACTTACTQCFTSNYTTKYLYYKNACYSTCPTSSYLSSTNNSCISCHQSCLTCNGSAYDNCLSCAAGWTLLTGSSAGSGSCISPCGNYHYLDNGQCQQCNINCQNCLSSDVCYICKAGAVLIGDVCQFVDCTSPCSTCEGSQTNCTSCVQPLRFYSNQCWQNCPAGTYASSSNCIKISQTAVYIPVTITSAIIILLLVIFRYYSSKKLTNLPVPTYKLNVFRISAVLLAYMELIAVLVLLIKNGIYSIGGISSALAIIGVVTSVGCNVAFGIGYWRIIVKHRVKNNATHPLAGNKPPLDKQPGNKESPRQKGTLPVTQSKNEEERSQDEQKRQQNNNSLKQRFVVVLSCIFTFRTYKILYSNLFIYRRFDNTAVGLSKTSIGNNPAMMSSSQLINPKPSPTNLRATDNPSKKNAANSKISSIAQPPALINTQISSALRATILSAIDNEDTPAQRKFNHPFLTYLTIISLFLTSLLYLLSGIMQAINPSFSQMMIWGIDVILVASLSILVSGLDLWMFVNLAKQEQQSQMSTVKDDANNTLQNLNAGQEDKALQEQLKRKNSVGSNRSRSRSRSPSQTQQGNKSRRKSRDGSDLVPYDHIPALKVFEDIDQPTMPHQQTRKQKRKWNAGAKGNKHNVNSSFSRNQRNASNNNLPSHKPIGYKLDDIYLNFKEDPPVDLNVSRPNFSEIPHREEDGTMSMVNIEGNFDDISGLGAEDAKFQQAVKFNLQDVVRQIEVNPFLEIKDQKAEKEIDIDKNQNKAKKQEERI